MDRCVVDLPTDVSTVPIARFSLSVDSGDMNEGRTESLDRKETSSSRHEIVAGSFGENCDRTQLVVGLRPSPPWQENAKKVSFNSVSHINEITSDAL